MIINKENCQEKGCEIFTGFYAAGDAFSEGTGFFASLEDFISSTQSSIKGLSWLIYLTSALTFLITFMTTFFFPGQIIRDRWSNKKSHNHDQEEAEESQEIAPMPVSTKHKWGYIIAKYSYSATIVPINFLDDNLLASAFKAWIQEFKEPGGNPLVPLSETEIILLSLYYISLDLPFFATNAMSQTCKEIQKRFGFNKANAPDRKIIDMLERCFKPLAKSTIFRKYIRIGGSIADTLEHILPLIILIPPELILTIFNQWHPAAAYSVVTVSGLLLLAITFIILAQTYLFEGMVSEHTLQEATDAFIQKETPWVNPKFAKPFSFFLNLGSLLNGVGKGLTVFLTLKEKKVSDEIAWSAFAIFFFIAFTGHRYSEKEESQKELRAITVPTLDEEELEPTGNNPIGFFFSRKENKHLFPAGLLDYPEPMNYDTINSKTDLDSLSSSINSSYSK